MAPPTQASVALQTLLDLPEARFQPASEGLTEGGTWREHPCLGDLDGDGRADLIASNREENGLNVWRSLPDGIWEPRMKGIPDNLMYGGSAIGDVDGDGDQDFLFAKQQFCPFILHQHAVTGGQFQLLMRAQRPGGKADGRIRRLGATQ